MNPDARMRDIADMVGITERAVQQIVRELVNQGYVTKDKEGRRNRYQSPTTLTCGTRSKRGSAWASSWRWSGDRSTGRGCPALPPSLKCPSAPSSESFPTSYCRQPERERSKRRENDRRLSVRSRDSLGQARASAKWWWTCACPAVPSRRMPRAAMSLAEEGLCSLWPGLEGFADSGCGGEDVAAS
ncbi:winged helix-turn-helix transcriptional regulator [Tessaracoccus flavescens]